MAPPDRQGQPPEARGRGRKPARAAGKRSDLLSRVLVGVPLAILAIVLVSVGGTIYALFMVVLGAACMGELFRMLGRWRPVPGVALVALVGMVAAARFAHLSTVFGVLMLSVPVLFVLVAARGRSAGATVTIAGTLFGIVWIGVPFAHAVLLRNLPHGQGVTLDILIGTFLGDTGAYLGGRMFGRRPLAPTISPNKTLEGLLCGMLVAVIAVFLAGLYQPWMHGQALVLGIAVAVLGPIGDLFESAIKRETGTKDAGTVFGAHGGALDRLDAVIFTIVAGYYFWLGVAS